MVLITWNYIIIIYREEYLKFYNSLKIIFI